MDQSGDKSHVNNHQALRAPSNALIMQRRLISAFNDNAFGVDVDVSDQDSLITGVLAHASTK